MGPRTFPFMLIAAGVFAASMLSRKGTSVSDRSPRKETGGAARRFVVERDAPGLGLQRGDLLRIEPEALIYLGDVVAVRTDTAEVVLTRFHDELMHCVDGLVVRESRAVSFS